MRMGIGGIHLIYSSPLTSGKYTVSACMNYLMVCVPLGYFVLDTQLIPSFQTCSHGETLTQFVCQVVAGHFNDKHVFMDLVHVLVIDAERLERGVGLQNMKYPPAFDDWCHELLCIRPEAYRSFRLQFAGRTERSFLSKRSASPGFCQGISQHVLERSLKYLSDYGYPQHAPLALSVDDTKLLPAFRPYFDGSTKKWHVVGNIGEPLEVSDLGILESQIESARASLATKLRLWVLQIPLPYVPPLILAVVPLASSTNAETLANFEKELLHILLGSDKSLCIVSLGSDGSILERDSRRALVRCGFAEPFSYSIPHPDMAQSEPIKIPLMRIHGRCVTVIQDPKHGRKTARNNLFSGARLLVLGNHTAHYDQVRHLASKKDTPLYWRDVDRLDRQDDRAAARLFSAPFLEYCIRNEKSNVALPIYLFVLGELIDAYENRHIPHINRVKMALRMLFFKSIWKSFLQRAGYSKMHYFISAAADDIIDILVDGLIGLIYVYRDHLDGRFPLLPWMHGSEANEHVFGLLRSLVADFTMLDVLRLIPKLNVRLMAACRAKRIKVDFRRTAAGYCHTYFDADDLPLGILSEFPSDNDITCAASAAFNEAIALWDLLGYYGTGNSDNSAHVPQPHAQEESRTDDNDHDTNDVAFQNCDRRVLRNALDSSRQVSELDDHAQARLNECTYAAACLDVADQERL